MLEKIKTFASNALTKGKLTAGVVAGTAGATLLTVMSSAEGTDTLTVPTIASQISQSTFNGILDQITALLPVVLPVVVAGLALRKGISFMIGMIRGI